MQLNRSEVLALTAASVLMIVAGATWLWGPIPLMVSGVLLLALAFFVDF